MFSTTPGRRNRRAPGFRATMGRVGRVARVALIGLVSLSLILVGLGGGLLWSLGYHFDTGTDKLTDVFPADSERPAVLDGPSAGSQNILLLATSRPEASVVSLTAPRTVDGIMIVHVPASRDDLHIMSILPDTVLAVPGETDAPASEILAAGGVSGVVHAAETLLGVRMDHVAVVDLAAVVPISESLGGISLYNANAFQSASESGTYFARDTLTLAGDEAYDFVTGRFQVIDTEFQRARNQQNLSTSLLSTVRHALLRNPMLVIDLANAVTGSVAIDAGLTSTYLGGLAFSLRSVRGSNTEFFPLPTTLASNRRVPDAGKLAAVREGFILNNFTEFEIEERKLG